MLDIEFIREHPEFYKIKHNKKPLRLKVYEMPCIVGHRTIVDKHVISVDVEDQFNELVSYIDKESERIVPPGVTFVNSSNMMNVKLPFRYRKFEIDILDTNGLRITPYDIKAGDKLDIDITCSGLWITGSVASVTWTANKIQVNR